MSEELKLLTDLYIDANITLEDVMVGKATPDPEGKEVIQLLRLAALIANTVSGIQQEAYQC